MDIWFISDTHFGHKEAIEYHNRPFKTVEEMDTVIIQAWNEIVKPFDIVYHLGDFGFGGSQRIEEIVSMLSGKKILIIGNHDEYSPKRYRRIGFDIAAQRIEFPYFVVSHEPMPLEYLKKFNVHGHIHNNMIDPRNYKNVCVELTNYRPIHFDEVLAHINTYK